MSSADAPSNSSDNGRRAPRPETAPGQEATTDEATTDCYQGVELAPITLESLVTWDVSGHAQRERDRLNAVSRIPRVVEGGY